MRRRPPAWKDSIGLTYYPSFGFERLPDPVGARAIDERGVRIALWRRTLARLRIAGVATAGPAAAAVACAATSWSAYTVWPVIAAAGVLVWCAGGLAHVAVLGRRLTRARWTVYACQSMRMQEGFPISMVLVDRQTDATIAIKIRRSKRSEVMRGMARPEVWLAQYADRRGILTVAGGGEMFVARTVRNVPIVPRIIPRSPADRSHRLNPSDWPVAAQLPVDRTPRLDPALDAAKRERMRAQREARRAKRAAQDVREPKLPRIRGARRLRFK